MSGSPRCSRSLLRSIQISGSSLRHSESCVPIEFLAEYSMVGGICYWARNPAVMHTLQTPSFSRMIVADGLISRYWEDFAKTHDVYSKLRLSTRVTGSYWEPQRARWRIEIESKGAHSAEHFDFVIHAIGRFNSWKLPEYPGMDKYTGKLMHSSNYDDSFDPVGKRIATIGNGASGIQVTPALQKVAAHIDHYARSPTWIGGAFTPDLKERQDAPMYISSEDREAFKTEDTYLRHRKKIEDGFYRTFEGIIAGSKTSNNLPEKFTTLMKSRLEKVGRADLLPILTPDFPPHCR